jgi:hypothetical protein
VAIQFLVIADREAVAILLQSLRASAGGVAIQNIAKQYNPLCYCKIYSFFWIATPLRGSQ